MKTKVRVLLSLLVVLATAWMAGCGHYVCSTTFGGGTCTPGGGGISGPASAGPAYLYFVDDNIVTMGLEKLDFQTNTFAGVDGFQSPPSLPVTSGATFTDGGTTVVDEKFLYIPFDNGTLFGFLIDGATGSLTPVPNSPYAINGASSITSDPAGNFLFVGDATAQTIQAFTVDSADGSLTSVGLPFATSGVRPMQLATDGLGKFLYATEGFSGSQVGGFAIDTTGALTPVPGSPFPFSMTFVAGEKTGKFLFGVDGTVFATGISAFSIDATTGGLTSVVGSPFTTTYAPVSLAVHPSGGFVYTFNEDIGSNFDPIEGFQIASTGVLTPLPSSPFTSLRGGFGQFEQSGLFLFALGHITNSGTVTPFPTDPTTGALSNTIGAAGFPFLGGFAVTDAP